LSEGEIRDAIGMGYGSDKLMYIDLKNSEITGIFCSDNLDSLYIV
jgi:hypothetical protein